MSNAGLPDRITVRIPEDLSLAIVKWTQATGRNRTEIVVEALRKELIAPERNPWREEVEHRLSRLEQLANL